MKSNVRDLAVEDLGKLDQSRDELHTWAFENVGLVEKTYRRVYANKADREAEIAAPLHTMAQRCGDPELSAKLRAFRSVVPIQCFIRLIPSLISLQTAGNPRETGACRCLVRPDQIHDLLVSVWKDSHATMYERPKDRCRQLVFAVIAGPIHRIICG